MRQTKSGCGCSSILGVLVLIFIIGSAFNCGKSKSSSTTPTNQSATQQTATEVKTNDGSSVQERMAKLREDERPDVDKCIAISKQIIDQNFGKDHCDIYADYAEGDIWIKIWPDGLGKELHNYLDGNAPDDFREQYDEAVSGIKSMVNSISNYFIDGNVLAYRINIDLLNEENHDEVLMRFMDNDFVFDIIDGFHWPYSPDDYDDLEGIQGEAYQREEQEMLDEYRTANDTPGNDLIEDIVKARASDFAGTSLSSVTINPNLGRADGSKVVLVYLNWDEEHSAGTANEILRMHSDDLASDLAEIPNVSNCAIFWKSSYLGGTGKWQYERNDDGQMYLEHNSADWGR